MPLKRPFGVTLLVWMVLSLSAWGAVRFAATLRSWDVLSEFDFGLSPLYLSITGAGWAVAGGVLIWGTMVRRKWAYPALPVFMIIWLLEYWVERIFFQSPRSNLPFALTVSALFLASILIFALHRSTKKFFLRSEEHEQQDKNPTSV